MPRQPANAFPRLIDRSTPRSVALETTLLLHGVPRDSAAPLAHELAEIVTRAGAHPALVAILAGVPIVGVNDAELKALFDTPEVPKINSANLGVVLHRGFSGATTVSTTMELAAAAGVRYFATGGLGGVHRGYADHLDISADLAAFTRFPVAVVTAGVKSILDVVSTREAFESLGVPVVGYRTDHFPAFYLPTSEARVDARFDDEAELALFVQAELHRTGRGVVIANPIPAEHALDPVGWDAWLREASDDAQRQGVQGRAWTPFVLAHVHRRSGGATLRANLELVKNNVALAARLAAMN